MKTLLILTGPQGSGNHLWSKVFAATEGIFGWSALNNHYWIPHDQEPFAQAWQDPALLKTINFGNYGVTSISCPYAYNGQTTEPDYDKFINAARNLGYDVKIAIIGRDQNILQYQQTRVRRTGSLDCFIRHVPSLLAWNPIFLSTELLYLYRMNYIHGVRSQLGFPVYITQEKLDEILIQDANAKYFQPAADQELDKTVRHVSGISE
jgi:hypothetical protein